MKRALKPILAYEWQNPAVDIHGADFVSVRVRADGKVIWIQDQTGTRLRICAVTGPVFIHDDRLATAEVSP